MAGIIIILRPREIFGHVRELGSDELGFCSSPLLSSLAGWLGCCRGLVLDVIRIPEEKTSTWGPHRKPDSSQESRQVVDMTTELQRSPFQKAPECGKSSL